MEELRLIQENSKKKKRRGGPKILSPSPPILSPRSSPGSSSSSSSSSPSFPQLSYLGQKKKRGKRGGKRVKGLTVREMEDRDGKLEREKRRISALTATSTKKASSSSQLSKNALETEKDVLRRSPLPKGRKNVRSPPPIISPPPSPPPTTSTPISISTISTSNSGSNSSLPSTQRILKGFGVNPFGRFLLFGSVDEVKGTVMFQKRYSSVLAPPPFPLTSPNGFLLPYNTTFSADPINLSGVEFTRDQPRRSKRDRKPSQIMDPSDEWTFPKLIKKRQQQLLKKQQEASGEGGEISFDLIEGILSSEVCLDNVKS